MNDRKTAPSCARSFLFVKADRLLKRDEFLWFRANGRKTENRYFTAVYGPAKMNRSRLGITVTRRVGNAVARNRIKRRVRELFRHQRQNLKNPLDINIIAKHRAAGLSGKQMVVSLTDLFQRLPR